MKFKGVARDAAWLAASVVGAVVGLGLSAAVADGAYPPVEQKPASVVEVLTTAPVSSVVPSTVVTTTEVPVVTTQAPVAVAPAPVTTAAPKAAPMTQPEAPAPTPDPAPVTGPSGEYNPAPPPPPPAQDMCWETDPATGNSFEVPCRP